MAEGLRGANARTLRAVAGRVLAALVGLGAGVALTALAGESPLAVMGVVLKSAFGSAYDLGQTLFYATPLLLTGLAVAVPYRAGLFNIGAEGQLTVGAMATTAAALLLEGAAPGVVIPAATVAGALAGGLWGGIAGWLKAYRGSHEVITTIMLNFIAVGLTSYVALDLLPSTDSQSPESRRLAAELLLPRFEHFGGAPVTAAVIVALLVAAAVYGYERWSVSGYELGVAGANPEAANLAGINGKRRQMYAMALGGALAGLIGLVEVLGNSGRFRIGFSPDYGFIGIPVALLAGGHPLGVAGAALMFGALQKGTADLDLETAHVTRDLAVVMQALVVLAVAAAGGLMARAPKARRVGARKESP